MGGATFTLKYVTVAAIYTHTVESVWNSSHRINDLLNLNIHYRKQRAEGKLNTPVCQYQWFLHLHLGHYGSPLGS